MGQSVAGSNGNEGILYIPQGSRTRALSPYTVKGEEKKGKGKKTKNRATPKRGNLSLELSYLLNPPPGDTRYNRLSNCSPTTPSSLLISIPQGQKSSEPALTMAFFYS